MFRRSIFSTILGATILGATILGTTLLTTSGVYVSNAATMIRQSDLAKVSPTALSSKVVVVNFPGSRPFNLQLPSSYNNAKAAPLIIALHGYTSTGAETEKYLMLGPVANARGILYVAPDGSLDNNGLQFWNATPACCNFFGSKVNDEAYIMSIINTVSKKYNVDQKRIYVVGHSNGGFMSHHMACSDSNRIAAIASFAGATYKDQSMCRPGQPITVLQVWGTADETIAYLGGALVAPYPGATETIADWAKLDKCVMKLVTAPRKINIESSIAGNETTVSDYSGCAKKTTVELWSIAGGHHVPTLASDFATRLVNFLLAHPKV
jgi:polyhydroxybutyrate depolymerase